MNKRQFINILKNENPSVTEKEEIISFINNINNINEDILKSVLLQNAISYNTQKSFDFECFKDIYSKFCFSSEYLFSDNMMEIRSREFRQRKDYNYRTGDK